MPKINVYLPDELAESVRESGVPVSAVCQRALELAVRRVNAIREATLGGADFHDASGRLSNFTPRAKQLLKLAVDRARTDGASEVGTEHLLAGLLAAGDNLGLAVLKAMEIEPNQIGAELDRQRPHQPATESGAELRFSGTAANALELSVTEAIGMQHNYIGCEHLLLGLVTETDGAGGQLLRTMGAEPRLVRHAVSAALAGFGHLKAQGQAAAPPPTGDRAALLGAAIRTELRPIVDRLERLEQRFDATGEGD